MPSGVYQRKPYMRSCGKLAGQHEYIRHLADTGVPRADIARMFGTAKATICRVVNQTEWNAGRSRGQAEIAEPSVIRAHDRRAA